ncbi:hypothetical protein VH571_02255 [Frondihabitans sp. 4ASC-45]|uniref:hypothetical protein n=1 Tax=Frondihabitans sp. 4ASC-45 TaxID=3111636 RepID=UPI003C201183
MIDDTNDLPFHPYLLGAEPERGAEPTAGQSGDEPPVGVAPIAVAPDPGPSFARTVDESVPVFYVAWELDRVVLGWLWWDDASGASWHVPNVFEEGAREADGRTLIATHPWVHDLAAAFAEGLTPSAAIQRLLADVPNDEGNLIPVQAPMRARSLRHLEQIAGLDDYRAAEARWREAQGAAAASVPAAVAADPAVAPAAAAPVSSPAPAADPEPAAAPTPAAHAAPTRNRRRFPFFWRRG